jgi:hypothetical protein
MRPENLMGSRAYRYSVDDRGCGKGFCLGLDVPATG